MLTEMFKEGFIVAYNVTNWQQAKRFYTDTLGLPVVNDMGDDAGWIEFGKKTGAHLALNQWRGPGPIATREGGALAIFEVEDVPQAVDQLRRRGVKCDEVVTIPNFASFANFYDPEGNCLQVAGPPAEM